MADQPVTVTAKPTAARDGDRPVRARTVSSPHLTAERLAVLAGRMVVVDRRQEQTRFGGRVQQVTTVIVEPLP